MALEQDVEKILDELEDYVLDNSVGDVSELIDEMRMLQEDKEKILKRHREEWEDVKHKTTRVFENIKDKL